MGTPNMYELKLSFEVNGGGFRFVAYEVRHSRNHVGSHGAGAESREAAVQDQRKNILIRGGGWTPDMMLRQTPERLADEFNYVHDLGLNTVRLEGKLEPRNSSRWPTSKAFW